MARVSDRTLRRRAFVRFYLECRNATKAAELAGYSTPNTQGPRLLKHPAVQAAVEQWLAENTPDPDEILARLGEMARGIPSCYWVWDPGDPGGPDEPTDEDDPERPERPARPPRLMLDVPALKEAGLLHLVQVVSDTRHGQSIRLYSAQDALVVLARIRGLLRERQEITGPDGGPVEVSLDYSRFSDAELGQFLSLVGRLDDVDAGAGAEGTGRGRAGAGASPESPATAEG